jgi:hypothetical protein
MIGSRLVVACVSNPVGNSTIPGGSADSLNPTERESLLLEPISQHTLHKRSPGSGLLTKFFSESTSRHEPSEPLHQEPAIPKPSMRDERFYRGDESYFREKGGYHAHQARKIKEEKKEVNWESSARLEDHNRRALKSNHRVDLLRDPDPTGALGQRNVYKYKMAHPSESSSKTQEELYSDHVSARKKFIFWDVQGEEKVIAQLDAIEELTGQRPNIDRHSVDPRELEGQVQFYKQMQDHYKSVKDYHKATIYERAAEFKQRRLEALKSPHLSAIERDHYAHKSDYDVRQINQAKSILNRASKNAWTSEYVANKKLLDYWSQRHASQLAGPFNQGK